jgi:hypothetical protein
MRSEPEEKIENDAEESVLSKVDWLGREGSRGKGAAVEPPSSPSNPFTGASRKEAMLTRETARA